MMMSWLCSPLHCRADKGGYGDGLDEHGESALRFGPPPGDATFRRKYFLVINILIITSIDPSLDHGPTFSFLLFFVHVDGYAFSQEDHGITRKVE